MIGDKKSRTRPYYLRRCKRVSPKNIESLPSELLSDILVRLPADHLYDRVRLVCRSWYHIIHSYDFVDTQIQHSTCGLLLCCREVWGGHHPILITATQGGRIETSVKWCADNCYSGVEGIELKVTVFETLRNLYAEYVEAYRVSTSTTNIVRNASDAQTGSSSNVSGVSSVKSSTSRSQSKYESFRKTVTSVDQMKSDFDLYFEEAVEEWNEPTQFDAIGWWKMHRMKYKILSKMACDVLSIPITTVASESAFSAGGRVIDPHRASLGVDTVQMLLCAEDWLRARYEIKGKAKDKENTKEITFT
ncbi:zinc finger BED domain-containing protein RICESLEEPER 2-like [Salvia miltiorrhiza]|uniref:zinc finger BED domain-containing protein RICESLEEPER 2-like n=1 Tax=Salvia miltiorrhiza TaxID=226208 RepID=UPI0025AD8527|nr:zinc finger BED domain-containing protein RICESLEEPER 2-like [Salvia miltiorrhiza]